LLHSVSCSVKLMSSSFPDHSKSCIFQLDIRSRWNDVHSLRRCPAGGLELPPLAVENCAPRDFFSRITFLSVPFLCRSLLIQSSFSSCAACAPAHIRGSRTCGSCSRWTRQEGEDASAVDESPRWSTESARRLLPPI